MFFYTTVLYLANYVPVHAETISKKNPNLSSKFKQTSIDKNPIFILDYKQIANSCVLVLKFK